MLRRKEILMALRKLGFDKISELKMGCRNYEKYFLTSVTSPSMETRRRFPLSAQ